jgi:hypothetical protein
MPKRKKKLSVEGIEASAELELDPIVDKSDSSIAEKNSSCLLSDIESAVKDLFYISETDAKILPFVGARTDAVTKENLLNQTKNESNTEVEERDFTEFFDQVTAIQDWFGDEEKAIAAKFLALRDLLKNNLRDLKVFKVGKIEIDIYVVGLDAESVLMGIQTKAVET